MKQIDPSLLIVAGVLNLIIGGLFCFYGKRFYPRLHSMICGIYGFNFAFNVCLEISGNEIVALIVGLLLGGLCSWACFGAEKIQAFVLGVLFGSSISGLIWTYIFSWWTQNIYIKLSIGGVCIIGGVVYSFMER